MSITMTNLQAEDSGTYVCAYLSNDDRCFPLKEISLNVFKELHKWELDSLSVRCPYSTMGYSTGTKAWCRREGPTTCTVVVRTDYTSTRRNSKALEDRTLIQDDRQRRTVTITMQKLQARDTGVYWCALYRGSDLTRMMEVRLSVAKSEYLLAARCGRWQISAPPPLLALPPVLCHTTEKRSAAATQLTPMSPRLPVSLAATLAAAPWACGAKAWPFTCCLLPARLGGDSHELPQMGPLFTTASRRADPGAPGAASPAQHSAGPRWALLEASPTARHCSCSGPAAATPPWSLPPGPYRLRACQHAVPGGTKGRGQDPTQFETRLCTSNLAPVPFCLVSGGRRTSREHSAHSLYSRDGEGLPLCLLWDLTKHAGSFPGTQQHTVKESGNVSVQCPYNITDYGAVSKAWCKEGLSKACTPLVSTNWKPSGYLRTGQQGRVTIQDDTRQGIVTITMEKLEAQDSGVYWCALYEYSHLFRMVEVTLSISEVSAGTTLPGTAGASQSTPFGKTPAPRLQIILWLVIGIVTSKILAIVILVFLARRRKSNSTAKASRTNPTQYPYKTRATKGRVTIVDYPMSRTMSITMTNLQAEDSGTYVCAYLSYDDRCFPLKEISLNVFKELHKWELDSLSVRCPYSTMGYSTGTKAWCRREGPTTCTVVVRTDYTSTRRNSKALEDRTLIQDDRQRRTVTITMQKLQARDTGVYWCALYRGSDLTRMMEVRLSVAKSEYLLAARCGRWQISAPPPLLALPPVLCHTTEKRSAAATQLTPMSPRLPVSLAATLAAAPWACGAKAWPFTCCLLPARLGGDSHELPQMGPLFTTASRRADPGAPGAASPAQHSAGPRWALLEASPTARHCSCSGPAAATPPWSLPPGPYRLRACQHAVPGGTKGRGQDPTQFETRLCTSNLAPVPFCLVSGGRRTSREHSAHSLYSRDGEGLPLCLLWDLTKHAGSFPGTQQHTVKESGNVSVQCPYNITDYGAVSKAWCKEGLKKPCTALVSTNWKPSGYLRTGQQGRVTIQDDTQQGIVTITMEKLEAQDSGVYWCALYVYPHLFRMVEVTLSISEVSAGTTLPGTAGTSQSTPFGKTPAPSSKVNTSILLSVILSIMFILALISLVTLCIRRRKQQKRTGTRQAEDTYDKPEDISQLDSTERMESPNDDSKDLKYATLNFKSQLSPEDPLYCNVEPIQTHRKPEDENVEYAIIELKQLPTNDKG
ncbi:LOW QUALITY PROTEIN: uncharacterized protein LJ206_019728 [Theristicus caerulescens]